MARHEIVIHENTSATSAVAPYLGNYIAKETLALAAFASAIGAKCGLPAIQVIAILDGAFQALEDLEREGLVRVHTDIGVICAVIKGSFPTADAAFDPERNSLELALRLDDAIQLDLTDTVPVIVTDESVTKLRVDNVMDLAEERPMNLIHGQHVFRVAGFNMVLTDEGATVYLENALGTTFQLVIDEVVSKQLFKAHTAELLPGGDYKLVVKSRAGDAGGPLQTSFRKVKYLRVVDPEPEPEGPPVRMDMLTDDDNPDGVLSRSSDCRIDGANLFLIDGDSLTVDYVDGESATHTLDLTSAATPSADGTSLAVATANKFVGATPNQNITRSRGSATLPGMDAVAVNCDPPATGETPVVPVAPSKMAALHTGGPRPVAAAIPHSPLYWDAHRAFTNVALRVMDTSGGRSSITRSRTSSCPAVRRNVPVYGTASPNTRNRRNASRSNSRLIFETSTRERS